MTPAINWTIKHNSHLEGNIKILIDWGASLQHISRRSVFNPILRQCCFIDWHRGNKWRGSCFRCSSQDTPGDYITNASHSASETRSNFIRCWRRMRIDQWTWRSTTNASIRKASSLSSLTRKDAKHDGYRAVARIITHRKEEDRSTTHISNRLPWVAHTQVPDHIWSHWLRGGDQPMAPIKRRD